MCLCQKTNNNISDNNNNDNNNINNMKKKKEEVNTFKKNTICAILALKGVESREHSFTL